MARARWLRAFAACVACAAASCPEIAKASLDDDATRLADAWKQAGFAVRRLPPAFLEQGHVRRIATHPDETSTTGEGCTTIVVLGPRGQDFQLRARRAENAVVALPSRPERALAGVATMTRCGYDREELEETIVEMRSARGALETIVARGSIAPPPVSDVLLERFVPAQRPPVDPGRAPSQESVGKRAANAEARAKADGAAAVSLQLAQANNEGAGRLFVALREGCHRLELFAELGAHGRVADLDAELRDAATNTLLARDRSDTPDARLDVCVGDPEPTLLVFAGAPIGGRVAVVDATWPLPPGVPAAWGPRARGTMAMGLLRHRAPPPKDAPILQVLGASGSTLVPFEIEPGRCYVASLASARGEARSMQIVARLEGKTIRDDGGAQRDGATIAFCARTAETTTLRVEARGSGLTWALAVWASGTVGREDQAP